MWRTSSVVMLNEMSWSSRGRDFQRDVLMNANEHAAPSMMEGGGGGDELPIIGGTHFCVCVVVMLVAMIVKCLGRFC